LPAKSKAQQQAAGAALAAKRGERDPKTLKGAALEMYKTMSEEQLEHYAGTKTKELPKKVKKAQEGTVVRARDLVLEGLGE